MNGSNISLILKVILLWTLGPIYPFRVLVFLGIKPEVSLLNINLVLLFWEISLLFSIVAIPIYISTNSMQGSLFFMFFVNFCYLYIFDDSPLRLSDIFQLNVCLFEFILSYKCCLYILDINQITYHYIFKYFFQIFISKYSLHFQIFSPSVGCLFILPMVSFAIQKILNLIRSYWFIFDLT